MAVSELNIKTNGAEELGKTIKSINELKAGIKDLEKNLEGLDFGSEEFKSTKQELDNLKNSYKEITKSAKEVEDATKKEANAFTDLKKQLKEAQGELAKFDFGTEGYNKAIEKIQDLKGKLGDLGDASRIEGTGIERIKQSVSLFGEAVSNLDFDKAKTAISGLSGAFKAIPIFLLIEGIRLLIENFGEVVTFCKELFNAFNEDEKAIRSLTAEVEKQKAVTELLSREIKREIDLLTAQGASSEKILAAKKELINQQIQEAIVTAKLNYAKVQEVMNNDNITESIMRKNAEVLRGLGLDKKAEELEKNLAALKFSRNKDNIKAAQESLQVIKDLQNQGRVEEAVFNKEQLERAKEQAKELAHLKVENIQPGREKELAEEELTYSEKVKAAKGNKAILAELEYAHRNHIYSINQKWDEIEKERLNQQLKDQQTADANAEEYLKNKDAAEQKAKQDEIEQFKQWEAEKLNASLMRYEMEAQARKKAKEESEKEIKEGIAKVAQYAQAISSVASNILGAFQAVAALRQQAREQEFKEQEDANNAQLSSLESAKDAELAKEGLTAKQKQDIQNKYALAEYAIKLRQYNQETELKKKAFEADKKFRIAQTIINTITGSMAALTGALNALPYPAGLIVGLISAASVATMGAIQVAQIAKQKFDAGTPPAPPSGGSASGGDVGGNQPDSLNKATLFSTGQNQKQTITPMQSNSANGNQTQPTVVKAVITEQEVTEAQMRAMADKERTTI